MPTKTKSKPKAKRRATAAEIRSDMKEFKAGIEHGKARLLENVGDRLVNALGPMVKIYETETGAKANQVRLIDFIRWWEEREKK